MRFRVDDIVKISKDSEYYVNYDECNPMDTEGRIGTTTHNDSEDHPIWVRWDNNEGNEYREQDLKLVRRQA